MGIEPLPVASVSKCLSCLHAKCSSHLQQGIVVRLLPGVQQSFLFPWLFAKSIDKEVDQGCGGANDYNANRRVKGCSTDGQGFKSRFIPFFDAVHLSNQQ